jgi:hypothetical protein
MGHLFKEMKPTIRSAMDTSEARERITLKKTLNQVRNVRNVFKLFDNSIDLETLFSILGNPNRKI